MHAHLPPPRDSYALRNDASQTFSLQSVAEPWGEGGSRVRAVIKPKGGPSFRYEVVFGGTFVASKQNFDQDMYHDTALSLMRSQLESRVYRDTRIHMDVNSGLPRTEVGVSFDWTLEAPQEAPR